MFAGPFDPRRTSALDESAAVGRVSRRRNPTLHRGVPVGLRCANPTYRGLIPHGRCNQCKTDRHGPDTGDCRCRTEDGNRSTRPMSSCPRKRCSPCRTFVSMSRGMSRTGVRPAARMDFVSTVLTRRARPPWPAACSMRSSTAVSTAPAPPPPGIARPSPEGRRDSSAPGTPGPTRPP